MTVARAHLQELDAGGPHHRHAVGRAFDARLPALRRGDAARDAAHRQVPARRSRRASRSRMVPPAKDEKKAEEKKAERSRAAPQGIGRGELDRAGRRRRHARRRRGGRGAGRIRPARRSCRATATSRSRRGWSSSSPATTRSSALRSRASFSRPLTVIREMEDRAQQSYLGKIKELEDSLNQTQEKLQALQKGKGGAAEHASSRAEQQAEIENFRKKAVETRARPEGAAQEPARGDRHAGVLDQGRQHRPGAAAGRAGRDSCSRSQRRRRQHAAAACSMNRKQFLILVIVLLVLGGAGHRAVLAGHRGLPRERREDRRASSCPSSSSRTSRR